MTLTATGVGGAVEQATGNVQDPGQAKSESSYLERLAALCGNDWEIVQSRLSSRLGECFLVQNGDLERCSIATARPHMDSSQHICIFVENIGAKWIEEIGPRFDIDPAFFRDHLINGKDVDEPDVSDSSTGAAEPSPNVWREWHGTIQVQPYARGRVSGYSSSRVSLLLSTGQPFDVIDEAPLGSPWSLPGLRLIFFPAHMEVEVFMADVFRYALLVKHKFAEDMCCLPEVSNETFINRLGCISVFLVFDIHVQDLQEQVESLEDLDIVELTEENLKRIHTLRRDLSLAKRHLVSAHGLVGDGLQGGPDERAIKKKLLRDFSSSEDKISELSERLSDLSQFFIGATNLRDAKRGLEEAILSRQEALLSREEARRSRVQAERSTMLTILAAIYLPLNLVTSLFGMNIKELNGGAPSWWVAIVALVVISLLTLLVFLVAWYWIRRKRRPAEADLEKADYRERQAEAEDNEKKNKGAEQKKKTV